MDLEEWFNPSRTSPDYVPGGFKGYDGKARSIPGHPFALKRSATERADLIAFLRGHGFGDASAFVAKQPQAAPIRVD